MRVTPMQRRYLRYPRLMFWWRRVRRVNYEPEMKLLDLLCARDRTSVDVGAKLGMYTYRLLRHSRDVVAFEPIPLLSRMLTTVFSGRAVRIEPRALSDAAGQVTMRIPYGSNGEVKLGRSTIEAANALAHDDVARIEEIEVEVTTLDACAVADVGFIKIDVEGHELAVLRGATRTISRDRPTLLIEANDRHHPGAVANVRELLTGLGYRGMVLVGRRLRTLDSMGDPELLHEQALENFIFVHESRPDVLQRLEQRFPSA